MSGGMNIIGTGIPEALHAERAVNLVIAHALSSDSHFFDPDTKALS